MGEEGEKKEPKERLQEIGFPQWGRAMVCGQSICVLKMLSSTSVVPGASHTLSHLVLSLRQVLLVPHFIDRKIEA